MKYNIWNKWDPLKVCMLGNNYLPEFFNGVPDSAGDPLKQICEETLQDLEGFKEILQQFGVDVIQPKIDPLERFIDNPHRYPRGPLQPRDLQQVLGNTCFSSFDDHPAITDALEEYDTVNRATYTLPYIENKERYDTFAGEDWPDWQVFKDNRTDPNYFYDFVWQEMLDCSSSKIFSSAYTFPLGQKLFTSYQPNEEYLKDFGFQGLDPVIDNFEILLDTCIGHSDGNFHPIKPGAILSLQDVQNYSETFPGWDVCYLPDQSWDKVDDFLKLKKHNAGKWWLAGEEDNHEFTQFVETWLTDWVGYVEETVFDVNVLMLDEHHCCVSNPNNDQVNSFFKKHRIEPVYIPWRHRYFWDGGLHCITLELYREGTQKNYFI